MGFLELAGVISFFGFIEAFVWRLPHYIVKLSDKEIAEIQGRYLENVIPNRLQQPMRDMDWLKTLTEELNLPRDTKSSLETSERKGKRVLILFLLSAITFTIEALTPGIIIANIPLYLFGIGLLLVGFAWLVDHYTALCETRKNLILMREKLHGLAMSRGLSNPSIATTSRAN